MGSIRVKNYLMFLLLYICSTYHYGCIIAADAISGMLLGGHVSLYESTGIVQVSRLKSSMLPVYGFETFFVMTIIFLFDYFVMRFSFLSKISMRQFLEAFLFSQLAYVGFIFELISRMDNGDGPFWHIDTVDKIRLSEEETRRRILQYIGGKDSDEVIS